MLDAGFLLLFSVARFHSVQRNCSIDGIYLSRIQFVPNVCYVCASLTDFLFLSIAHIANHPVNGLNVSVAKFDHFHLDKRTVQQQTNPDHFRNKQINISLLFKTQIDQFGSVSLFFSLSIFCLFNFRPKLVSLQINISALNIFQLLYKFGAQNHQVNSI